MNSQFEDHEMTNTVEEAKFVDDDAWDDGEYLVQRMEWVHAASKRDIFKNYSNARDANDEGECKKLERQNPYLVTLYDEEGPCQYTEYQQYLRLIVYWLHCVKDDKAYGAYCDTYKLEANADKAYKRYCEVFKLRPVDKKQVIPAPPAKSFVQEFHTDWGDVRDVQDEMAWVKSNSHLFMPAWIEAVEPGSIVPSGVMSISVPADIPKPDHVDRMFALLLDQARLGGTKPKYQIEKVRGENYAETAQRLHVSGYVYEQFDFWNDTVRGLTRKYVTEWELFQGMQGLEYAAVPEKSSIDDKDSDKVDPLEKAIEKNRKNIRNWKETYELCITGAITKDFPPKHTNTKA